MKPYQELTYLGRVRRMRRLAQVALAAYGIADARFKLLRQAGNTLYRVYTPSLPTAKTAEELFEEGQYLLRVHEPGYQEPGAIELELAWLAAMRRDADLPVPVPIPTLAALQSADVEFVLLEKCGHFWHECPDQFYSRVRAFLGLAECQEREETQRHP